MPLTESVTAKIREELTSRGISLRELARRLDVSQMWVIRRLSENPEVQLSVADLDAIAAAIEVPVTLFLPAETATTS